jgi:hypothetical protein
MALTSRLGKYSNDADARRCLSGNAPANVKHFPAESLERGEGGCGTQNYNFSGH